MPFRTSSGKHNMFLCSTSSNICLTDIVFPARPEELNLCSIQVSFEDITCKYYLLLINLYIHYISIYIPAEINIVIWWRN